MGLKYNGIDINQIKYNGVLLDKILYNGVVVYEAYDYTRSYFFIKNPSSEYREFKVRLNALTATESNPIYIWYYYLGEGREKPTEPASSITSTGKKTLTFGLEADGVAVIELIGGQFEEYNTSYPLFYQDPDLLTKAVIGTNCRSEYHLLYDNDELTDLIFAIERPFAIYNVPKLTNITFVVNPTYIGSVSRTGLSSFTVPANVTSISQIANNPNLETLTILPTTIELGQNKFSNNTDLKHMYVYCTSASTAKSTSYIYSWVNGSNPGMIIHLSSTLDMSQAKALFGDYFNYTSQTDQATVLFDL